MPDSDTPRGNNKLHRSFTVGWVLWLLALAVASLLPVEFKQYSQTDGLVHQAMHLAGFAVAGALSVLAFRRWFFRPAILVFALAVLLEWMQARKFGNSLEIRDILMNLIGAASGVVAARWLLPAALTRVSE